MKKRLLYISPHLSTGGQPQYVYKQIEAFKEDFEIEVVEINNVGGEQFAVQKNKIRNLVPLHILGEDKSQIISVIKNFSPHIIHFHEIPQFDLSFDILDKIFDKGRDYFIVATTHGSFTNPDEIRYHPDRYVLVSEWSRKKFETTGVETTIWDYPIENYSFDKIEAQTKLGFEKDWKHVLNVGLFAPGKNQKEIFQIANKLKEYKIKFHFIGNQALNFEEYWKPLMNTKPDNCVVWGERNDVDTFYAASDAFYFSSILELNPLSIKEALSYKLPSLFRRLHTYLDTYDSNPLVNYIDNDLESTKNKIIEILKPSVDTENYHQYNEVWLKKIPKIQIKHLQTKPNDEREVFSRNSIEKLKEYGIHYELIVNTPYDGFAPKENCRRPDHLSKDNRPGELYPGAGLGWITGRHYGCYLAHRGALETMSNEYDYTLIFEADAYIHTSVEEFVEAIYEGCKIMKTDDVYFLSFANNPSISKTSVNNLFSKTAHNQDLAHAYMVRNTDKLWWLDRMKDCEWDVADLWYNHVFYKHPVNRYTTNVVYSKQADGISLLDDNVKKWQLDGVAVISDIEQEKSTLIISAGRRVHYLSQTLEALNNNIENLKTKFKKVWLLDDRSNLTDRANSEILMRRYFDDKFNVINFNNNDDYAFVDKFNIIKSLVDENDIIFFMEDDWVLNEKFDIDYHINRLRKSDWTQIAFADPLWIQSEDIQRDYEIDEHYWKNPFPKEYVHPYEWNGGNYKYSVVKMHNWTNNPSLVKGDVYHKTNFEYKKNFEAIFADATKRNQVFHKKCLFTHIGTESIINKL
jgi:GR25 family glycosyltransferase involved in LPS biosynthesis